MNINTGEFVPFNKLKQAYESGIIGANDLKDYIEVYAPDPNCKKCYGRGHTGRNKQTGKYLACKCTRPGRYLNKQIILSGGNDE